MMKLKITVVYSPTFPRTRIPSKFKRLFVETEVDEEASFSACMEIGIVAFVHEFGVDDLKKIICLVINGSTFNRNHPKIEKLLRKYNTKERG